MTTEESIAAKLYGVLSSEIAQAQGGGAPMIMPWNMLEMPQKHMYINSVKRLVRARIIEPGQFYRPVPAPPAVAEIARRDAAKREAGRPGVS